jgi:peptidoglycan/LPS O-acetylase OafA/YrhL
MSALEPRHPTLLRKINNLTGIRGFAAIWVALFHFQTTPVVASLKFGPVIGRGAWGVDIFFVLSGLILSLTYANEFSALRFDWSRYRAFLLKRLARIYPLHLVTFLAMLTAWEVAKSANHQFQGLVINDWWTAFCNVILVHGWGLTRELSWNTPSWSVSAEWFAYVFLFPFCAYFMRGLTWASSVAVAALFWVALLGIVYMSDNGNIGLLTTDGILRIIPEFISGYACYRLIAARRHGVAMGYLTLIGAGLIAVIALLPQTYICLFLPAIVVLLMGLYYGGRITDMIFGNCVIVFLGEISYSIYMLHVFAQMLANYAIRRLHISATHAHGLLILCFELLTATVFGYLAYRFIESPAREFLADLIKGRLRQAPAVET